MSAAEGKSGSATRLILIILAICITTALLMIGACAGIGYWAWTKFGPSVLQAQTAGQDFLDDIRNGAIEEAYNQTSLNFRARYTLPQFKELVKQYPALTTHTKLIPGMFNMRTTNAGTMATKQFTAVGPQNSLSLTLHFIYQQYDWVVDDFTVP